MPRGSLHAESLQGGKIERFITDAFTNTCAAHFQRGALRAGMGLATLARCALVCTEGHRVIVSFRGAAAATEQRRRCRDVASRLETQDEDGRSKPLHEDAMAVRYGGKTSGSSVRLRRHRGLE